MEEVSVTVIDGEVQIKLHPAQVYEQRHVFLIDRVKKLKLFEKN